MMIMIITVIGIQWYSVDRFCKSYQCGDGDCDVEVLVVIKIILFIFW